MLHGDFNLADSCWSDLNLSDLYRATDAVQDLLRAVLAHTGGCRVVLVNVSLNVQLVEAEAVIRGGSISFCIKPRAFSEVDDLPAFVVDAVVKAKRQLVIDEPGETGSVPRGARFASSMRASLLCLPVTRANRVVCALVLMGDVAKKVDSADRYALEKIAEYAFALLLFSADAQQAASAMATRAEISLSALRRQMSEALTISEHDPAGSGAYQEEHAGLSPHALPIGGRWLDRSEPDHRSAQTGLWHIVQQSGQAMNLISDLRGLAGESGRRRALFDLNDAVMNVLAIVRADVKTPDIRLVVENFGTCETSISGDRHLISLALLQIFRNSLDTLASVQGRARTLTVRYENSDANRLQVDISDTGAGVTYTATSVFRAFATNRPGKLGLGMALCKSIVELHQGSIDMFANQPYGSTVRMYLPLPEKLSDTRSASENDTLAHKMRGDG